VVSGSYDPGDLYLLRGLGKGAYAPAQSMLDRAGVPLAHHPVQLARFRSLSEDRQSDDDAIQLRIASFGSWPAVVDWDGDGDLDLLIGSFAGSVYRRENVGTRAQPQWAEDAIGITADGKAIHGNAHACPAVADWDGDGRWDLLLGWSDGSVCWFPNLGDGKQPRFGASRPLVAARSKDKSLTQYVGPEADPTPGVRAQIAVVDHDGDGRLDLVVGDYSYVVRLRQLAPAERAEFEAARSEQETLQQRVAAAKDADLRAAAVAAYEANEKRLRSFAADPDQPGRVQSFVWLYRRTLTR
jgi:hypothetical protein